MEKSKVYQPQYFRKFQCTGSECRSNCCRGWTILIDEATYEKYMGLDEEARKEFEEKIEVTGRAPFSARIVLNGDGVCGFLDDRGLCSIQLRYGHDYLSYICRAYPRKMCNVAGETEAFLGMSCEAAARIILLEQNIIKFEDAAIEREGQILFSHILEAEKYAPAGNASDVFWSLRTGSAAIAQSRQHRLRDRMLILGMYIKQASELMSDGRYGAIKEHTDKFLERIQSRFYDDLLEQTPGRDDLDVEFILGLLRSMELKQNEIFNNAVEQALGALGISPSGGIPEGFHDDFRKSYERYFADKEYVLENYVVNHIFSDGFPFNYKYEDSIMKNYKELLVKYNLVKFMLVGISKHHNKFDKRRVVECVSSFSRSYDHQVGGALVMR